MLYARQPFEDSGIWVYVFGAYNMVKLFGSIMENSIDLYHKGLFFRIYNIMCPSAKKTDQIIEK